MDWLPELKNKNTLKADIVAWSTVALVLIPQSMAYAQLAWLNAIYWLYASFLPVMIAALWWSSRQLATWPSAVVALITAASLWPLVTTGEIQYAVYAAFLALMVWIIQLVLWIIKMGKLVDFLSHPVIVGFTNAAAIIIGASQLNKIFWLEFWQQLKWWLTLETADHKYTEIFNTIVASLDNTHYSTFMMWISSIFVLILMKKLFKKIPWVLVAVVFFTIISYSFWYEENWWLVIGAISWGIPWFSLPFFSELFDWDVAQTLFTAAITISLIGFAEWISIAKTMASESKQSISANRELIWQWLWNISSSLFQWMPVSGSFSRSAVNFSAWALTGFSSVVTWLLVAIALLFLTPLLYHLPQATLAAVIIVAVAWIFKVEPIIHAWKVEKHDWIVAIITFFVTLISAPHLEKWLIVWIGLSLSFFIYRTMTPEFVEVAMYKNWELEDLKKWNLLWSSNVWVYQFEWPLYFANAWFFEWKLIKFVKDKPAMKLLVLDIWWVEEIDSSGLDALQNLIEWIETTWIKVLISKINSRVYRAMKRWHFIRKFGKNNIYRRSTQNALKGSISKHKMDVNIKPFFQYMPKEWKRVKVTTIGDRILRKLHIK